jgi:hypothetical protein
MDTSPDGNGKGDAKDIRSLEQFAQDVESERRGKWMDYRGNLRVKLRRATYAPYRDAITKLATEQGLKRAEIGEDDIKKLAADHLVVDWNFTDLAGNRLVCDSSTVLAYFRDDRYSDFYDDMVRMSHDRDNFSAAQIEEMEGNSPTGSTGK